VPPGVTEGRQKKAAPPALKVVTPVGRSTLINDVVGNGAAVVPTMFKAFVESAVASMVIVWRGTAPAA
jgi:hypothetical protein